MILATLAATAMCVGAAPCSNTSTCVSTAGQVVCGSPPSSKVSVVLPELRVRLWMAKDGNITGMLENAGARDLSYTEVRCKLYDIEGVIIDAPWDYVGDLGAHEAARIDAPAISPKGAPVRFDCKVKAERR